jgi:hypothetical protein
MVLHFKHIIILLFYALLNEIMNEFKKFENVILFF